MRVEDASLMDPEIQENPFAYYRALHEQAPVYEMPDTGFFLVGGYEELRYVIDHPEIWSNDIGRYTGSSMFQSPDADALLENEGWKRDTRLQSDPPDHQNYRSIVAKAFTAGRIKKLAPFVEELVTKQVDALPDASTCEFMSDFAAGVPIAVITKLLGLPSEDAPKIKHWSDVWVEPLSYGLPPKREIEVARLGVELQQYLAAWMKKKRDSPEQDVLTELELATFPDGTPLPIGERIGIAEHLIVGGHETASSALGSGLMLLGQRPEVEASLRKDASLIRPFVEEVLRLESPSQGFFRYAVRDGEVGGVVIPKGSMVHVRFAAANRDPRQFKNPDKLDLYRKNAATHMAFSTGVHHCIGAPLARLELQTAFRVLLERWESFELLPENTFEHLPGLSLRTLKKLHIRYQLTEKSE